MTADELKEKENPYRHIVEKLYSVACANDFTDLVIPPGETPDEEKKYNILSYLRHALFEAREAGLLDE